MLIIYIYIYIFYFIIYINWSRVIRKPICWSRVIRKPICLSRVIPTSKYWNKMVDVIFDTSTEKWCVLYPGRGSILVPLVAISFAWKRGSWKSPVWDTVIFGSDEAHTYVEMSSIDKKAKILLKKKKNPKSQYKTISPRGALQWKTS